MTGWTAIEVVKDEDFVEPPPEPVCPVGFANHTWGVSIYEGAVSVYPLEPCPTSNYSGIPVCHWFEGDDLFSDERKPLAVVKLAFACDCQLDTDDGSQPRCRYADCNRWLDIVPVEEES